MKTPITAALLCAAFLLASANDAGAAAADDALLQRLATCQDSWLDWKNDPVRQARFVDAVEARYTRGARGAGFAPKAPTQMYGLTVTQLYPQSVGMALGFSMLVQADLARTRRAFEAQLGRTMTCTNDGEGSGCELKLGERKTAVLMAESGAGVAKGTLLGCYYYYEQ